MFNFLMVTPDTIPDGYHGLEIDTFALWSGFFLGVIATLIFMGIIAVIKMIRNDKTTSDAPPTSNTQEIQKNDSFEKLKKYKELLDSGIITQEEFDTKKKEILGL